MGAARVIGVDRSREISDLAMDLGAVDDVLAADASPDELVEQVKELTNGRGVEVAVGCSGAAAARVAALRSTRSGGRLVLAGEGGGLELDVSALVIHPQRRIIGSRVTSVPRVEDLLEHLVRWDLHPERTVTGRYPLAEAHAAYAAAAAQDAEKIAVLPGG